MDTQGLVGLLEQAFDDASKLQHHKARTVQLHLQRAVAELDPNKALVLRGKLASGGRDIESQAIVNTTGRASRFNTTPPKEAVFADPTKAAGSTTATAQPAAPTEQQVGEEDALRELYTKIVKMTPSQVIQTYNEGGVIGMIKTLGGDHTQAKKPNQKAAYLQQIIKEKLRIE
jgi:hypothetical protein